MFEPRQISTLYHLLLVALAHDGAFEYCSNHTRIEVNAVLEAEWKRRSRVMSVQRDTFGDRKDSSRLFGSTITAFNDHKKRHAPKLQIFRMNSRMNSMDEDEEKKEDNDVKGVQRPSRAIPQSPFLDDDTTEFSKNKPSTKEASSPSVPRRVTTNVRVLRIWSVN